MRTLQEKYTGVLEGKFSKAQFIKDARYELPRIINNLTGFDDTVKILMSRNILHEAKEEEKSSCNYSLGSLERGIDYELEKMGLDSAETPSEKDYEKAKEKAEKCLEKDTNYYINLLAGESKKVNKHDQMEPVKKSNNVDNFNGLKKGTLKEAFDPRTGLSFKPGEKRNVRSEEPPKPKPQQRPSISSNTLAKIKELERRREQIMSDMEQEAEPEGGPIANKYGRILNKIDLVLNKLKGIEDRPYNELEENHTGTKSDKYVVKKGKGLANWEVWEGSKKVRELDNEKAARKFASDKNKNQAERIREGRLAKIKGGKVVKEDDYGSGGYVESMGPKLEKALVYLTKVWDEWKNGPATEAGMVPHAKKDLLDYLGTHLKEQEEQKQEAVKEFAAPDPVADAMAKARIGITSLSPSTHQVVVDGEPKVFRSSQEDAELAADKLRRVLPGASIEIEPIEKVEEVKQKLKEGFKKIIRNILAEEKKLLKEAKAENLEGYINYENDANPELAARIRKGATDLADHIAKIEKMYLDTRQHIENIYSNIGPFMSPPVSHAFKKDLEPILQKYRAIQLPKSKALSPEEQELISQHPKGGVNESKRTKYTNKRK